MAADMDTGYRSEAGFPESYANGIKNAIDIRRAATDGFPTVARALQISRGSAP